MCEGMSTNSLQPSALAVSAAKLGWTTVDSLASMTPSPRRRGLPSRSSLALLAYGVYEGLALKATRQSSDNARRRHLSDRPLSACCQDAT
jgi:hypothetical protein